MNELKEKNKLRSVTIKLPENTYKKMRQKSLDCDITIQEIVSSAVEREVLLKGFKKDV